MVTERLESRWSRLRWLPVLVAVFGLSLSVAGWGYLVLDRREQIGKMAANVAAQSRRTAAASVRSHVAALLNLAGFWAAVGRRPVEEWRADAQMLIESYPDLEYIAWIYPDGRRARVAAGKYESLGGLELEPGEAKRLGAASRIIGPERDDAGAWTFRVLLPVRRAAIDLGTLEARLRAGPLLERALEDSAPGYAISILWGDETLFSRNEPTDDPRLGWWREEGSIALPFDTAWTAIHAPTREFASAWLDPIPHYLLAAGIVLSITLGLLSHQLRLTYLRARFLAAGNEALEANAWELRRLNEVLETRVSERTKELEAFTHSISHDLKSPLGAILNFATILELEYQEKPLDEEGLNILKRIHNSAVRGTELLEGLLRLSRAGHSDLRSVRIDMTRLARESFAQARQTDLEPDVEFVLDSLPDVVGDPTLIREALINLFDNALKYSRGREKRRVSVRGRVEDGRCLYEIEDNGQGFDMRFADKLFGLFQRLPSSKGIEGTGVGLALVARIVHRHGGTVSAEGRVGEGARFSFTLPPGATNG
jgi:signal transduction histidine kinase